MLAQLRSRMRGRLFAAFVVGALVLLGVGSGLVFAVLGDPNGTMSINNGAAFATSTSATIDSNVSDATSMSVSPVFKQVDGGLTFSCGIATDGSLWMWGNLSGTPVSAPIRIGSDKDWKTVSAGVGAAAIKENGTLWTWDPVTSPSLVQVNSTTWKSVAAGGWANGYGFTLAVTTAGDLYGWGYGGVGQLGDGRYTVTQYTPALVSSGWSSVYAGPGSHAAGIKTNGDLYTWGSNSSGQLGLGTSGSSWGTPQYVGPGYASAVVGAYSTVGLKTDGRLFAWGWNGAGQLGTGDTSQYTTPHAAAGGTADWAKLASGDQSVVGLKTDGTLWAWGLNTYGQLGNGTNDTSTVPVQVGAANDWTGVGACSATGFGLKATEAYSWGAGVAGQLGDGTLVARTAPSGMAIWAPYQQHLPYTLASTQGTQTVSVRYRDAGGATLLLTDSIMMDSVAPDGMLILNNNRAVTTTRTVPMNVWVYSDVATEMSIENGPWVPYVALGTFTLTAGDGPKTVTVKVRDAAGNTKTLTGSITLDTTPPSGTMALNNGAATTPTRWTVANSSVSGATSVRVDSHQWVSIDGAADGHVLALDTQGDLWGWGNNANGGIGDGTTSGDSGALNSADRIGPTRVATDRKWIAFDTGGSHNLAIDTSGKLYSWGLNTYGQLGNGTTTSLTLPVAVESTGTWVAVSAGGDHSMALKSDGTLWVWGSGTYGQLGVSTPDPKLPYPVNGDTDWESFSAGSANSYAIKKDGSLWGWGLNGYDGAVGAGTSVTYYYAPTRIGTANDWKYVAAGGVFAVALKDDGSLWTWGRDGYQGLLGLGSADTSNRNVPTQVGSATDWTMPYAGVSFAGAKRADGTLWLWGTNYGGTAASPSYLHDPTPVVDGYTDWKVVSFGQSSVYAVTDAGSLRGFGYAPRLSCANSQSPPAGFGSTPVSLGWYAYGGATPVLLPDTTSNVTVTAEYADAAGNVGTASDSIRWSSDPAPSIILNDGATKTTSTYLTIKGSVPGATQIRPGRKWQSVDAGFGYTMLHIKDGPVEFVGNGQFGQRGDGLLTFRTTSFDFGGMSNVWAEYSGGETHSLAIAPDGSLWAWGYNTGGCVGIAGEQAARPVQLDGTRRYRFVFAGQHTSFAIREDGTLWSWGENGNGQLGDGTKANHTDRRQVGTDADWVAVSNWGAHTIARKADGSLWAWGLNSSGQLGLGDTAERLVPTRIAPGTSWLDFEAGCDHTLAIRADGSLWAWGANASGQVGDGTTTNRTVPTRVGLYRWRSVAAGIRDSLAIRSDGSLWAWGNNSGAQLGDGSVTNRTTPVRIGTRTDWENIDTGGTTEFGQDTRYHSVGTTADGRVFTWGYNGWGGLGDGTFTARSSPVEIPRATQYAWAGSLSMTYPWASGESTVNACFTMADGSPLWLSDGIYVVPPGPSISSVRPVFGSVAETDTPLISAKITVNAGARPATVQVSVDGTTVPSTYDGAITQSVTALVPGLSDDTTHSVQIKVTDAAGTVASASTSFLLEKGPKMAHWDAQSDCRTCHGAAVPHTNSVVYTPTADDEQRCMTCHMGIHGTHVEDPFPRYYYCQCHYYSTAGTPNWTHRLNPATCRTCHTMFVNGQDPAVPETPRHTAEVPTCTPCHRHDLRFEHARRKTDAGVAYGCNTCHTSASTRVQTAITNKDSDCAACHDTIDHVAPHVSTIDAKCQECHSGNLDVEHVTRRGLDCEVCHSSTNSAVFGAIRDHKRDCSACHGSGGHPHAAADLSGVANGSTCANCHSMDLLTEHSKPTASSSGDPCKACHGASNDGPRSSFTTWNRTCVTGACHVGTTAPSAGHSWTASTKVDYATACKKCHWPSAVHYVRYSGDSCSSAGCHTSWPRLTYWYIPSTVTPQGRFSSAASLATSSTELHRIHVNGSWVSTYLDGSRCESCHGAAGCSSCHTSPTHGSHGPGATAPESYWAAFGSPNPGYLRVDTGNIRGDDVKITSGCSAPKCHVRSKAGTAAFKPKCADCH